MKNHNRALSRALIIALVVFIALPLAALQAAAEPTAQSGADPLAQTIKVGIAWSKPNLSVSAAGGFSVTDEQSGQAIAQAVTTLSFSAASGGIAIADYGKFAGPIDITAAPESADNYLAYSGKRYRGTFQIVNEGGQLVLINVLPLEEYLYGVLPKEIGGDWPLEAQKAQAVSARTFAMASIGKYGSYDVRNNTDSQVYGGFDVEVPLSTEAVQETAGQVATYNGQLISTYFYASSGGYTESNENVWTAGTPSPYLRSVPDPFDQVGPWNHWHRELTLDQIGQSLAAAGYDVGTLYEVTPEEKQVSGRWVWVTVRGSKGTKRLSSNAFRIAVGTYTLPSTLFTMVAHDAGLAEVQQFYDPSATPTVVGGDGQPATVSLNGATVIGADGTATLGANGETEYAVVGKQMLPAGLTFDGSGWGHGVGMSQWGAYGMAQQGYNYQDILKHYYSGIAITNLSLPVTTNEPQQ